MDGSRQEGITSRLKSRRKDGRYKEVAGLDRPMEYEA